MVRFKILKSKTFSTGKDKGGLFVGCKEFGNF